MDEQEMVPADAADAPKRRGRPPKAALPAPAPVPEPMAAPEPPAEPRIKVRLLRAYWPADGRLHPNAAKRIAAHRNRFDAGDVLEVPLSEALSILNPMTMQDVVIDRNDEYGRKMQIPYVRPAIAVRVDPIFG